MTRAFADVDELFAMLAAGDHPVHSGQTDGVGLLAHGLQCAWELWTLFPDDDELAVAGLVHDIGHQLAPGDDAGHGNVAADAVRPLLGARVADLAALHVPAKRYLVTAEPTYGGVLSTVSTDTLERQGGPMQPDDLARFLSHPHAHDAVALRRADDAAKVAGRSVPGLDNWRTVVRRVARWRA